MNFFHCLLLFLIAAPSLLFLIAAFLGERRISRYRRAPLKPSVEIIARKQGARHSAIAAER